MDIKPRPNHRKYIEVLRRMTPAQRLKEAFEMHEFGMKLFAYGLRKRFPDLSEDNFHKLFIKRLEKCHNRNW